MPEKRVNKDAPLNLVIEPYLKMKLTELANESEMSTGAFIRKILKDWLKENVIGKDGEEMPK